MLGPSTCTRPAMATALTTMEPITGPADTVAVAMPSAFVVPVGDTVVPEGAFGMLKLTGTPTAGWPVESMTLKVIWACSLKPEPLTPMMVQPCPPHRVVW